MTRDEIDWSVIKLPVVAFVIVLVISVALVFGSLAFKKSMLSKYDASSKRFDAISSKYLTVDDDENTVKRYYPRFLKLYSKGFIGRERRLQWIETLRSVSEETGLSDLQYSISPQGKYDVGFSIDLGGFSLHASAMQLTIDMLHEGDWPRFIAAMERQAKGMFVITECSFLRKNEKIDERRGASNVGAVCELHWLNIRAVDRAEIKLS